MVVRCRPASDRECPGALRIASDGKGLTLWRECVGSCCCNLQSDRALRLMRAAVAQCNPLPRLSLRQGEQDAVTAVDTGTSLTLQHEQVLPPGASQADVYESAVSGIVDDVLDGFNGTIMAYGQVLCCLTSRCCALESAESARLQQPAGSVPSAHACMRMSSGWQITQTIVSPLQHSAVAVSADGGWQDVHAVQHGPGLCGRHTTRLHARLPQHRGGRGAQLHSLHVRAAAVHGEAAGSAQHWGLVQHVAAAVALGTVVRKQWGPEMRAADCKSTGGVCCTAYSNPAVML